MFNVIAVATDGSDTAQRAVEVAMDLAERFGAKLVVLSAYAAPSETAGMYAAAAGFAVPADLHWDVEPETRGQHVTRAVVDRARTRGLECDSHLAAGEPARAICDLASACDADLLVVGNRGMKRRILGSVPNSISHNAPCAVLIAQTT
jgi:nucleotide-binding universal stress UspA family protein